MSLSPEFDATRIAARQAELTALWHRETPAVPSELIGFPALVAENHLRNFQLWHEEDVARRDDLGPERIRQAKRVIDRNNQERNNFIEKMDEGLVTALQPAPASGTCPQNSETPGMIIDRLSILALKEYHMREETGRTDVGEEHRQNCTAKLNRIRVQRADLVHCLGELLVAVSSKTRTFGVYYQFKMYNDPALNPQLYGRAK